MTDRPPRWIQVGFQKSPPKQNSIRSHSSRYTPRKSNHASDQGGNGIRHIAHNITQNSFNVNIDSKTRSVYNYAPSDQGNRRRESDLIKKHTGTESISNSKSEHNKRSLTLKKDISKIEPMPVQLVESDLDAENQFKNYLKYIDEMERKFQSQKLQIENMLLDKQEQIKQMKNKIIQAFSKKGNQIKDRGLRKMISNRLLQRQRPETNVKLLAKVVSEKKIVPERQNMLKPDLGKENSAGKRGGSVGSQGSWASGRFDKIFNTLNQMKTNLNDCKKLRQVRSPSKSSSKKVTYNKNKGNLVNTNQLRVKSKKTYQ